jgi:hypothetical protein
MDGSQGQPPDDGIPDFLKREPAPAIQQVPQQELPMRTDDEAGVAEPDTPDAPPAKPDKPKRKRSPKPAADKPAKAAPKKAAGNGKGNGHAAVKQAAKGTKTAAGKVAKPTKGKVAAKGTRKRDPAKLDQWGFRKDSIKSKAAAIYAKGKGATLADVKEAIGSVQFNLLTELKASGFKVEVDEVKGPTGRIINRYKLHAKA